MKIVLQLLLLNLFAVNVFSEDLDPLIITLPNGQIRGQELLTATNKLFYAFRGIPYATPPVGNLRFQAPLPAQNWNGILNATKDGASCLVKGDIDMTKENEDCLSINVYTPKLRSNSSSDKPLPVLFWICGGGFSRSSSLYEQFGPDYLIEEDVIFVSFNYRVGPWGFLSTEDTIIPGNAGLKDQNLALKWTNENIHLFGGDPTKITITGESAGGMSVTYHMLSPSSAGLFRAAISSSGTALSHSSVNHNPLQYATLLLDIIAEQQNITIDHDTLNSKKIQEILLSQSAEAIMQAVNNIEDIELTKPTIEVPHDGAFLTDSPYVLLENGTFHQVPIMMGVNSEEGLGFAISAESLKTTAKQFDENPSTYLPPVDLFLKNETNISEVTALIKDIYLGKDQLFQENIGNTVQYTSDNIMARSITKHAELQAKYTDVFLYQFSYHGVMGGNKTYNFTGEMLGDVAHGEDLPYYFKMDNDLGQTTDLSIFPKQDLITHYRIIKLWANFIKTLNPIPEKSDLLQNIDWPAINPQSFQYLDINFNLTVVNSYPRKNNYEKWCNIFYTYGVQPFYNF